MKGRKPEFGNFSQNKWFAKGNPESIKRLTKGYPQVPREVKDSKRVEGDLEKIKNSLKSILETIQKLVEKEKNKRQGKFRNPKGQKRPRHDQRARPRAINKNIRRARLRITHMSKPNQKAHKQSLMTEIQSS